MSFLSEAQRAQLDAALSAKEAEKAAAKAHHKSVQSHDRKSRRIGAGGPKKAGGGGKFTWGGIFTNGDQAEGVLDKNDPNYDSDEERTVVLQSAQSRLTSEVQQYKQAVLLIVEEYFTSADVGEVAESLEDLGAPDFMHYFVKRLVTLALDRKGREREMASVLLSSLYSEVIPPEQVQKGFLSLVDALPDTSLDVPDAPELLALFIARAVVDDCLPPAFASKVPEQPEASAALRSKLEGLIGARHGAEKVLRCWGTGAGVTHTEAKASVAKILDEYSSALDAAEASRCLRALNVPFFHHEIVKQALHKAMVAMDQPLAGQLLALLQRLSSTSEVSASQLLKGFQRVASSLEDLALDNPAAFEQWSQTVAAAKAAGLVDDAIAAELVTRRDGLHGVSASGNGAASNGGARPAGYAHGVSAFKAAAVAAVKEYFDSSDAGEVARRLAELDEPGLLHIFVKQAVALSLDRKARERELVSTLLRSLCPKVIPQDQMAAGFTRLLGAADDLVLDCPEAVHLLSLFLGRAIVDEILPPSFLAPVLNALRAESLGVAVVKAVGSLLSARHGAERLTNCWQGGVLTLEQVREQIKTILKEFLVSRDAGEASRALADLGLPSYRHEAVVGALEAAFLNPVDAKATEDLEGLLAQLSASGVVNQTQMTKGFQRVRSRLDEEALDFGPKAKEAYLKFVEKGTKEGWLTLDVEA